MAGVKGKSGRKHIPTAILRANGTRECELPKDEPQPELSSLEPPPYLSASGVRIWKEAAGQLDKCGVLTVMDEAALVHYCEQYVIWQQALAHIRRKGMLLVDKKSGVPRANPSIRIANDAHDRLMKIMVEFGMTPSARARVKIRGGFRPDGKGGGAQTPQNKFALIKGGVA